MAQPPILKAKLSDHPTLRDLANFVVPKASAKWYNLGLQLFDPRDEGILHSIKMESSKHPEEQCTEVFHHWLTTKKNATWNKLCKSLKSQSVNLPNVARSIEKMLDHRNHHSVWARSKNILFRKRLLPQSGQIPTTITEGSSSYDSSDAERTDLVGNDESDEVTPTASPSFSRQRTRPLHRSQMSIPLGMNDHQFESHFRSRPISTSSLPAALHSLEYDISQYNNTTEHQHHRNEERECTSEKSKENALYKLTLAKEKEDEEITEQLKELTKQLNYKEMYENEQKKCSEAEDQLREEYKQNADTFKQLLEKERLRNEEILKQNELLLCRESMYMKRIFEESKKELATCITESEAAPKNEMLERDHLMDEENLKQKVLTDKLNEEMVQLKSQLTAYEKQWESHANYCKELSEMYEKRINITIDTFNEQIKDNKEAHRKELDNLQSKLEEFKEEQVKKLKNNQESQRKELYDLQLKVEELNKGEAKKLEDTNEAYKKELHSLQVKLEELRKEVAETIEDKAEIHRKEMIENKHLRDEESIKQKLTMEKLKKEITQLKNQLNSLVYEQETKQEDVRFTEKFEGSIKKLYCKELNAREEMYEKRINKVIATFNKQLNDSAEAYTKQLADLQCKMQELIEEKVRKLENSKETLREELSNLQLKIAELKREVNKTFDDTAEAHRKEMLESKHLTDEENLKQSILLVKLKEEITHLKNQIQLILVYEKPATEQEDVQFTQMFEDGVRKLHHKQLNTRDEIYEKRINKVIDTFNDQFEDNKKAQRMLLHNLQLKVEELEKEAKTLKSNGEVCRNNLTLMAEKLMEEVKNLEEKLKEQNNKALMIKENIFASKLEDHERICSKEINAKLEIFEKTSKRENESFHNKIYDLQLEVDKLMSYFKQDTSSDNGENKEETVLNDFAVLNIPPVHNCSVDIVFTSPDQKPTSDKSNANPSLQSTSTNLLNHAGEQNGPSPESFPDCIYTATKPMGQENVSEISHLQPLATGDRKASLQKEQNSEIRDKTKEKKNNNNEKSKVCPICCEKVKDQPFIAFTTCKRCKQAFCNSCLNHKPCCPACTAPLIKVISNQPSGGTMAAHTYLKHKLPGYEQYGAIQIKYVIPSGTQGKEHPNPGQPFHGTECTAYVPDSPEGRKVLQLLRKAFDARLIFTVRASHTSGATDAVVWNDIHHKTNIHGGPTNYGYPDPTYLDRVLEELAAKGITE